MADTHDGGGFGSRLRELRAAQGLSQADLAGDGLSPSYVSLLESGKRTPTATVVAGLAGRLGSTESYLLYGEDALAREQLELAVKYAELALRNGEAADALDQATRALAAADHVPHDVRTAARQVRAEALEGVGRLEEAITELEALAADARSQRRVPDAIRLTVSIVRCYRESGDIDHAISVAETALAEATAYELAGTDVHAQLAATLLGLYTVRGDLTRADLLADETLRTLDNAGSRRARGSVFWNASLNAEARGNIEKALVLADKALALFAEEDDARATARLRVAHAWLLLYSTPPRPEQAHRQLTEAREALLECGTQVDLAYCETELARAKLLLDQPEHAYDLSQEAIGRLSGKPRHETAHTRMVAARALLALDRQDEGIAEFRAAALALSELGIARQAASAWRELADAFTELHLFEDAALAYQQALTEAGVRAAPDVPFPTHAPARDETTSV